MLGYCFEKSSVTAVQLPVQTNALTLLLFAAAKMIRVPSTLILKNFSLVSLLYRSSKVGTTAAVWMTAVGLICDIASSTRALSVISQM